MAYITHRVRYWIIANCPSRSEDANGGIMKENHMSQTDQPSRAPWRRKIIMVAAAAVAALLIMVFATQLGRGPSRADAIGSPSPSGAGLQSAGSAVPSGAASNGASAGSAASAPAPGAAPADVEAAVAQDAAAFVSKSSGVLAQATEPSDADLAALATGSAKDALVASSAEFAANGWHQVGEPSIVTTKVASFTAGANPPTLTLNACIDSSSVSVVTADGTKVRSSGGRSLNIMTFIQSAEGKWLVSRVSFPDDPTC